MDDEHDEEIDVELYIQYLLAYSADKELKKKTVDRICEKTGLPPEKIEEALQVMLNYLMNNSARSN